MLTLANSGLSQVFLGGSPLGNPLERPKTARQAIAFNESISTDAEAMSSALEAE